MVVVYTEAEEGVDPGSFTLIFALGVLSGLISTTTILLSPLYAEIIKLGSESISASILS